MHAMATAGAWLTQVAATGCDISLVCANQAPHGVRVLL